ncbi:DegT/DnrJ/EryC1/StrS family aminotransferase [Halorhodospira neutriphila]|uniref:DegT/DnrJ/EryC1/StrS aminotransferase family protein n=1 Tax=Halorhodospira neutriphila TaxID=168379 RepID=UPI00237B211C|nr:DegT/DnrJ/EryC1/StrS family aminotransferase [Halorhodospira neutriphila]
MADRHFILDPQVLVDLWLHPNNSPIQELIDHAQRGEARAWLVASSLPLLEQEAIRRTEAMPADQAQAAVRRWLAELLETVQVLTAHGFEQPELVRQANNLGQAQIAAAARSLSGADACVVSQDERFDALGELPVRTPEDALAWLQQGSDNAQRSIAFIDLAAQQHRLRPQLEQGMEQVLRHGRYVLGPEVGELEEQLADFVGTTHCVTVADGTAALYMALMALEVGPGDEVIVPAFTFIATAEVVSLLGARPVLVDIDPWTYNIDPEQIEAAITPRTQAIMPVSLYGQCADMDAINAIAERHGLPVIEDGAQSLGATYKGRNSCALTTIGCTSFMPSKPLGAYGDGGACFTNDPQLAERIRQIRVHGASGKYYHVRLGFNGRLDTLQAAVLKTKLAAFPDEIVQRQDVARRYDEALRAAGYAPPYVAPENTSTYAQYTIEIADREAVQEALRSQGVPTAVHYPLTLHQQPVYATLSHQTGDYPVAEAASDKVLSLPMHADLNILAQTKVVKDLIKNCTA